jgi:hypothetical protein
MDMVMVMETLMDMVIMTIQRVIHQQKNGGKRVNLAK